MSRLWILVGDRWAFEDFIEKEIEKLEFLKQRILMYRGNGHVIMNGLRLRHITSSDQMRGLRAERIIFLPGAQQLAEFELMLAQSKTRNDPEYVL